MRIGLALGNGSAKGYALIPIIQRLEKERIKIDLIAGSSVGAIVGTYYCLHGNLDGFIKIMKNQSKSDFFKSLDFTNPKHSLIKGKKIFSFFYKNFFGNKTFKDLKKPLIITATNLFKGHTEFFESGKIIDAVMASISIPGVLPPYRIKNQYYIDGGVLDSVPTEILLLRGMDKVIGVNLNKKTKFKDSTKNALNVLMATYGMMLSKIAESCKGKNVFMLEPTFTLGFGDSMKFYHWKPFYDPGTREINHQIDRLKEWLNKSEFVDSKFW